MINSYITEKFAKIITIIIIILKISNFKIFKN